MGRILLQLAAVGMALGVALLILVNMQPAEGVPVTQLQPPVLTEAAENTDFSLPYTIPDTGLVVESLTSYDGNFVEDGVGAQVSNVAAVMLHNTGPAVAWVQVMIHTPGGILTFCANTIPADSRVMVLEQDARKHPTGSLMDCSGQAILDETPWLEAGKLQFAEVDMGTVAVTNVTDRPMESLRIYYKTYHADVDIFLGGVTYCHKVEALAAGETVLIRPEHYAKGYSRIVRVSIE